MDPRTSWQCPGESGLGAQSLSSFSRHTMGARRSRSIAARVRRVQNLKGKGKRPSKWPIPKRISDKDFEYLVTPAGSKSRDFEIPSCYAKEAKKRLDNIMDNIAAAMRNPAPDKKGVRPALGSAAQALNTAQRHLKEISSEESWAFNSLAIAAMVNDYWLLEISLGEFQPTPW